MTKQDNNLKDTCDRLSSLLSNIDYTFVIADNTLPDCPLIYISPGFAKLTGYNIDEILGKNCRFLQGTKEYIYPEKKKELKKAVEDGTFITTKLLNYKKDGTPFWNFLTMVPIKNSKGQTIKIVGIQNDITKYTEGDNESLIDYTEKEKNRTENNIRYIIKKVEETEKISIENFYKDIPEITLDLETSIERFKYSFCICDPTIDNIIIFASEDFLKLSKYNRHEILGKYIEDFFELQFHGHFFQKIKYIKDELSEILILKTKDGRNLKVFYTYTPILNIDNTHIFNMNMIIDITNVENDSIEVKRLTEKAINIKESVIKAIEFSNNDKIVFKNLTLVPKKILSKNNTNSIELSKIRKNKNLTFDDFEIIKKIGKGGVGNIFLVKLKNTELKFVIKIIYKRDIETTNKFSRIVSEYNVYKTIDHPYIMNCYEIFEDNIKIYFVLDYCHNGSLYDILLLEKRLEEKLVKKYIVQLISALEFLHINNIIHRDLKPENILLDENDNIKLIDFDLSFTKGEYKLSIDEIIETKCCNQNSKSILNTKPIIRTNSLVGTRYFISPEIIKGEIYGSETDWWSLGILMYNLLYGDTPFKGEDIDETFDKILKNELIFDEKIEISEECKDLITKLLKKDFTKRIGYNFGSQEIKKHPYFNDIQWDIIN